MGDENLKKKIRFLILLLAITIFTVACEKVDLKQLSENKNNQEKNIEPSYGGVINLPLTNLKTLNPLLNQNELYYYFNKLIFESLFEFDDNLDLRPELAESYSIENNGRTISIKLRDDAYWHDGEALTAEDIIFTLECIKTLGASSTYGSLISQGIGALGDYNLNTAINITGSGKNISVDFDKAYGNNLEVLTFPILPAHIFENVVDGTREKDFKMIGTGPFKYKSYTNFKELRLVANEEYREGRPYLDEVVGKILGTREDTLRAFETGQVNTLVTMGTEWEKYGKNSRMKLVEYASANYEFLGFNFKNPLFSSPGGKFIRKAIAYSIDRDKLIEKIYLGHGTKTDVPIHPDSWLKIEGRYDYDLDKAREELKKAGLGVRDGEGYYLDANNKRISFRILTNSLNPLRRGTADLLKKSLKDLGFEAEIFPNSDYLTSASEDEIKAQWDLVEAEIKRGNFDILVAGWEHSVIPEISFMFHSSKLGRGNYINYGDPSTDRFLENAFYSGTSRENKVKAYEKLERNLMENLPYISLLYKNKALIMDKRYHGKSNPSFYDPYRGVEKLYIYEEK